MESQPPTKRAKPESEEQESKEATSDQVESTKHEKVSDQDEALKQKVASKKEEATKPVESSKDACLSPLERLPKDLLSMIIEYVPERAFDLRLASPILQSHLDDYVRYGMSIPLVSELGFTGSEDKHHAIAPSGLIYVNVFVRKRKAPLFELSLKLRKHPEDFVKQIERETTSSSIDCIDDSFKYQLEMDPLFNFHFKSYWDYLILCLEPRVNFVSFFGCNDEEFTSICKHLPIPFDNMGVVMEQLSDSAAEHLIKIITSSKVEHISLQVGDVTAAEPTRFLLNLASLVRAIIIIQDPVAGIEADEPYLFGVHNGDWEHTIMDMFAKKMDKLYIENGAYREYLTSEAAGHLVKNLPATGKKVWFKASFFKETELPVAADNTHLIRVAPMSAQNDHRMLSLIHESRLDEPENGDY